MPVTVKENYVVELGYLRSWSKYDQNLINLLYMIYIIQMKSNWINDVPVNILEFYTYYSTHRN